MLRAQSVIVNTPRIAATERNKMKRIMFFCFLVVGVLVVGEKNVCAHVRDYIFNQQYYTTRKGEFEIESYNDLNLKEMSKDKTYNSKHQVELEYGVTNHLQLAFYELFQWDQSHNWQQDAFKVETKYRFFEAGELPVDVALYGEYANPNGPQKISSDEVEGKLILSRDCGPWNLVANLIAERQINRHEDLQWSYMAGASYLLNPKIRLGLELRETLGDQGEFGIHRKDHQLQLLPGIYASLTPNIRILFGPAIGLTRAADDLQLKSIVEVEF